MTKRDAASFQRIDRLSDLPDNILHHILSFLDAKSLFRTRLLSRRWGSTWKQVPVLDFSRGDFKSFSSFEQHVIKFLSLRSHSSAVAAVSSVTFEAWNWIGYTTVEPYYKTLFDKVMKYAAAGSLHHLSLIHSYASCFDFHGLAASVKAHYHHRNLKTLNLKAFYLDLGGRGGDCGETLFSGFNLLTDLELHNCFLKSSSAPSFEPLIDVPCLKRLKLVGCNRFPPCLLKVSGFELLDLEIQNPVDSWLKLEVSAPKLKSFSFWGCVEQLVQLNLPSLDHASIRVRIKQQQGIEATNQACMKLLPQLHNVQSLNLRFDKMTESQVRWEPHEFPLISGTEPFAELEVSPFTRLKSLRVLYPYKPPNIPYQVIRYFFNGSPPDMRKSFTFQKSSK